jgi:hypothetical protein
VLLEGVGDEHKPCLEPDRGGITAIQDSTSRQPPRQVNWVVGGMEAGGGAALGPLDRY